LLIFLVPFLNREFPKILLNNVEYIHAILSSISPKGIAYLQPRLKSGEFKLFSQASNWQVLKRVLRESLQMDCFEQQSLWQLVLAHRDIKIEHWIHVLPSVDTEKNPEAILAIRQQLEYNEPSAKVCSMLFARDEDELVVSSLFHWARQKETRSKLIESLTSVITKAKSKAPRKSYGGTAPTTRQVLIHLNAFRYYGDKVNFGFYTPTDQEAAEYKKHSDKVFSDDSIMAAVLSLKDQCDNDERDEFSEILNLVEDTYGEVLSEDDEPSAVKSRQKTDKKRKAGRKAKNGLNVVESDSDSDDVVNPQVKKPKRL